MAKYQIHSVPPTDYRYFFVGPQTTALVKTGAGYLHNVIINAVTVAGVLAFYDAVVSSNTTILALNLAVRGAGSQVPYEFPVNVNFATGLFLNAQSGSYEVTVSYS